MSQDPLDAIISSTPTARKPGRSTYDSNQPTGTDWTIDKVGPVKDYYKQTFGKDLPVAVEGQGAVHNRLGYDHTGSLDLNVHPSSKEGAALREYFRKNNVPFLAFDRAVPGVATGPHIHVGYPSKKKDALTDVISSVPNQKQGAPAPTRDALDDLLDGVPASAQAAPPVDLGQATNPTERANWEAQTPVDLNAAEKALFVDKNGQPPLKTPQVSSRVVDDFVAPEQPQISPAAKPLEFKQGQGPIDNQRVPGIAGLASAKYKAPEGRNLGEAVTAKLPEGQGGSPDALAHAAFTALGPQYAELNQAYRAATGRNMADVSNTKTNPDGTFSFQPSKHTIDFINAFASGMKESGVQEGLKRAAQVNQDALLARQLAEQEATQAASGQVQQAENLMHGDKALGGGKESFFNRGLQSGTAPLSQATGTLASLANTQNDADLEEWAQGQKDFSNTLQAASEQADIDNPAKTMGQHIAQGAGSLVPTALEFAATGPLGPAQLPVLGALHGKTPEERIKGAAEGAAMQGAFAAAPKVLGNLSPTGQKVTTGAAIMAPPVVQSIAAGQNPTQAIIGNLPFAAMPFLHKGGESGKESAPTELNIEKAAESGVQGRGALDAEATLAAREAKVKPVTDAQGNVLLNAEEVAANPDAKPKIKLANSPTDEPAHAANFRERAPDGTFVEGPAVYPEEFKPENVAAASEPAEAQPSGTVLPNEIVPQPVEAKTQEVPVKAEQPSAIPPAESKATPESSAAPAKEAQAVQPYEMTRGEIEQEFQRKKAEDDNLEVSILGPELAKRYARLQRAANSMYDPQKADAASAEIEKIEASLSERDRNRLYGIGETGPQLDDLRNYRQSLGNLDDSSPQSLAESMRWAVSRVGDETDPLKMSHDQQVAYGTLREAARIAHENGWDTQAISREAVRAAGQRFSDPEDAAFMLDRFIKKETAPTKPIPKQIEQPSSSKAASPETLTAENAPTPEPASASSETRGTPKNETVTPQATEAAPLPQPVSDRRVDLARRRVVSTLSPEEMQQQLLTSDKVDLPNERAYNEAPKKPVQVMSDIDGLKALNDTLGYAAGTELMNAKADALKAEGLDAYHIQGDEFRSQFDTAEEAHAVMKRVQERLKGVTIEAVTPDGRTLRYESPKFSYGVGEDSASAEASLHATKAARETSGERTARGELPESVAEVLAAGDQVQKGNAPTQEVATAQPEPSMTSARKADVAADRKELERKGWQQSLTNAKEKGLDQRALAIANEVLEHPHALNDEQTAGLVLRRQQIKNEHAELQKQIYEAKGDDLSELRARNDILESEAEKLQRATDQSGTEKGRALASQKLTINQDMDLVSLISRAKAKGLEITPSRRAKYEAMDKEINGDPNAPEGSPERVGLKARTTQLEEEAKTKALQDEVERATKKTQKRTERVATRKALDDEFADLRAAFAKAKIETKAGVQPSGLAGLDPEGKLTKLIGKMARNRLQAGVSDAGALVDQVYEAVKEHIEGITKRDVRDAILGVGLAGKSPRSELAKQLDAVRSELRAISKKEDIESGKIEPRTPKQPAEIEKARLRKEIEGLDAQLRGAEKNKTVKQAAPKDDETQALIAERDLLKKALNDPAAKQKDAARSRIAELDQKIIAKDRTLPEQPFKYEDPEMQALDEQRRAKQRELSKIQSGRDLGPKQGPTQAYTKTRTAQLLKQEAELQRRIAEKDYSPKPERPTIVYHKELNEMQARVESLRRQYQHDLESAKPRTLGDLAVRWKRFAVLTYPATFGKLGTAATGRMITTPLEEIAGGAMGKAPGLKTVFGNAPRQGGLNIGAEAKAVSQLWQSQSFKDILGHLKGGEDMLTLLYGKHAGDEFFSGDSGKSFVPKTYEDVTDRPGHYHAAVKVIPKRAEFFRSFEKRLDFARKQGKDINDPAVQMGVAGESYVDAQRAILQQANPLSDAFNGWVQNLSRSKFPLVRGLSKAARFEFPITRVPVNYVGETALNVGGLPAALGETAVRGISGKVKPFLMGEGKPAILKKLAARMPDALNELTPEQSDRIARSFKKGAVGLGFLALGMARPDMFGGYYQPGKRDPDDVKAGQIKAFGVKLPRWVGHIPLLEAAQFGATIRRVYDSMSKKGKEPADAAKEGTIAAAKGMIKEVPFIDPLLDAGHGPGAILGTEGERSKFVGGQIKSVIPGAIQSGRAFDYGPEGTLGGALNPFGSQEPVKREQKTVGEVVKEGFLPTRKTLPISSVFPKASKASDEVQKLGISLHDPVRQPDESTDDYNERKEARNTAIREALEGLVSSPEYDKLSSKEKAEQIKLARDFAVKNIPKPIRKLKDLKPAMLAPASQKPAQNNNLMF